MDFCSLAPDGPILITPQILGDARGYFMETFRQNVFVAHCGEYQFVQDNQSSSSKGILRGLHYQLAHPQGKLVRVIRGKVYDVAVDLRRSASSFCQTFSVILDDQAHQQLWIPPGFAHGFLVLSEEAEFVYKCTDYYSPADEYCLKWDDPSLAIHWPLSGQKPLISEKDSKGLPLGECPFFD